MALRAGYLTCNVASGWGFIFGSSRNLKREYALQPGYTEYYTGSITKFGADIGYVSSADLTCTLPLQHHLLPFEDLSSMGLRAPAQ